MVSAVHGPSGAEVAGLLLTPEIASGLGMAISTLRGTLPAADKALLTRTYPDVCWMSLADMVRRHRDSLIQPGGEEELSLSRDLLASHRWSPGCEKLKVLAACDPQYIRRLLNRQVVIPAVENKRSVAAFWFWVALRDAWAAADEMTTAWQGGPEETGVPDALPVTVACFRSFVGSLDKLGAPFMSPSSFYTFMV
jgi:hypothetical protein